MKILEQFILGKSGSNELCEDAIFVSENFIAVIDGATAKTSVTYDGDSPGIAGRKILLDCLMQLPATIDIEEAIKSLSGAIYDYYVLKGVVDNVRIRPAERITTTIALFSNRRKQIWLVGDCQCMVNTKKTTNNKLVDTIVADVRAYYLTSEISRGKTIEQLRERDTGREYIRPLLERQYGFQNSPVNSLYRYGVVDGFEVLRSDILAISVADGDEIILASDGYPVIHSTLQESEAYLKKVIDLDPLCYREYKSTKGVSKLNVSFDDRSFIKFIV